MKPIRDKDGHILFDDNFEPMMEYESFFEVMRDDWAQIMETPFKTHCELGLEDKDSQCLSHDEQEKLIPSLYEWLRFGLLFDGETVREGKRSGHLSVDDVLDIASNTFRKEIADGYVMNEDLYLN